jgi:hypothetical protein
MYNGEYYDEVEVYKEPEPEFDQEMEEYQETLLNDPLLSKKIKQGKIQCIMGRLIEI